MLTTRFLVASLLLILLLSACVVASVPPMISYQGKLMQPSGAAVPDGTYSITFAIYDVATAGSPLWSETNPNVQVKGGLFSVLLGSVINLPGNIFDNPDRFFGVKVGTDPEMTPRQKIASVGYAVKAGSADIASTVPDSSITGAKIASSTISGDKLAAATVTVDKLAPGIATPVGTIVMWSGEVADVPQGWKLCDGTSGTPDLRNRFIVGAGDEYAVAATGGEKSHQLAVAEMPTHNHGVNDPGHQHALPINWSNAPFTVSSGGGFSPNCGLGYTGVGTTGITLQNTGGGQPHENRPPYYALCFIMKVGS